MQQLSKSIVIVARVTSTAVRRSQFQQFSHPMLPSPSLLLFFPLFLAFLRADEIPRNELLVSISSPSSCLPSQSSLRLALLSSSVLLAAPLPPRRAIVSSTRRSLSTSSRVRSRGNSDVHRIDSNRAQTAASSVPGIRLEIARNSQFERFLRNLTPFSLYKISEIETVWF